MSTPSILIIDDEPGMILIFSLVLQRAKFKVSTAPAGKPGLEQVYNTLPDLILLDMMLPDMKGTDLILQLRQDPNLKHIKIIAMTAYPALLGEARASGADMAFCKPIRPAKLVDAINRLL